MFKALIFAVILVSAFADEYKIPDEERKRIGDYLYEKAKDLSMKKILKEEFLNSGIEEIVQRSGKSGSCVDDAVQEWKGEGIKMIESAFGVSINELKTAAAECSTLPEEQMEVLLVDVDSGNIENKLYNLEDRVSNELQKTLQSFTEAIEKCQ